MLSRATLLTAILLSPTCFPNGFADGGAFQSRHSSAVQAEEYAAYSAFINQKYIPSYSTAMYTLQGDLVEDGELDESGMVVIAANIQPEFGNQVGVSRSLLESFAGANSEAETTFDDLVSKSGPAVQLRDAFNLTVPYEVASDKKGHELYRIKWDRDKFRSRFPRSKGLLAFSRIGFDAAGSKASFLVAQLDVSRQDYPTETTYLVLLKKEARQWTVNKVYPREKESLVIDLARCEKASRHIPLALGSESFQVTGRDGDACVLEQVSEIEQGYKQTRCRIPIGLGKLIILESNVFVFSRDLSKYCEKPVYGRGQLS